MKSIRKPWIVCFSVLCFLLSCITSNAQNLVQNPGFDDTLQCPNNQDQVDYAVGWSSYGDSPDYFNSCSFVPDFQTPSNWGGYQLPASGEAYCALGTYAVCCPNNREFVGQQMLAPLQIGMRYYVSLKVSLSLADFIQSYVATDKLGVLFTTQGYSWSSPPALNNFAHVYTDSLITDSSGWTMIQGSFVADSAYSHVVLGNFFDDQNTDTLVYADSTFSFAYYFVDDICVSTDSAYCADYPYSSITEVNLQNTFSIYPNPASQEVFVKSNLKTGPGIYMITIYDAIGKELFRQDHDRQVGPLRLDISGFPSGMLYFRIEQNFTQTIYKLIKQ